MRGIGVLPYWALRKIGTCLGFLAHCLPLMYVRIARRNIELCFPELATVERDSLVRRHCDSLCWQPLMAWNICRPPWHAVAA
jgi:Kdo2-lipid IVA lauroyltransferase/acyltransferase